MKTSSLNASPESHFHAELQFLKLQFILENYQNLADQAAREKWSHQSFLQNLIAGQAEWNRKRSIQRKIRMARFPVVKTIDQYQWEWPDKIEEERIRRLFDLNFIKENTNPIFLGGVGMGKTHLATALGYQACLAGYSVLFANTADVINTLAAAKEAGKLKYEMKRYLQPSILVLDEIGYLPIDKLGSDLLFQIISQRYECGSIILTTNKPFAKWPEIFNNDSVITSAILDRLLHHAEVIAITGKSYRMKDRETPKTKEEKLPRKGKKEQKE